ncbi:hypothetical protein VKT23_006340 [Stygiomarasmius scandens]|uniref:Fe2OG dioxygenase domain-containing protein n=1 Tax=Marasmiellus scandens TaxID=2682957 RepID=A0ABR1JQT4_9AGAR
MGRGHRAISTIQRRREIRDAELCKLFHGLCQYYNACDYGDDLAGVHNSSERLLERINQLYPSLDPCSLPSAPSTGILAWKTNKDTLRRYPGLPPISLLRLHKILDTDSINVICNFYDALIASSFRFPPDKIDRNRSAKSGAHLGVWMHYSLTPMITGDARLRTQRSQHIVDAMDRFLQVLKDILVPLIRSVYKIYFPNLWDRQVKAQSFVRTHFRPGHREEFEACVALDFEGSFFCAAIKEGSSELWHVDWNDDPNTLTWIIPVGQGWEGAEFCVPQLGVKVPILPGQVLGALTRCLVHCAAPSSGGRRLVLTLFCDHWIMKHSDEWVEV